MMEIWAAIDIHLGQVVSLRKGRPEESTLWSNDPLEIADRWQREGAYGLHLIDLDAALGNGSSKAALESIIRKAKIPVQVGGGIRKYDDAERWLSIGVDRVILGTLAFENPTDLNKIMATYGSERTVVAVDYKNGMIVTHGWTQERSLTITEALSNLQAVGVKTVLATATELDGMAKGPDLHTLRSMHNSTTMHILASGGIRTKRDIRELQQIGVQGAIAGRALYEGTLQLSELGR
jgi:phosphoribosylformimino-5-aminoimidazole carboxamide ribotide isomerase